MTTIAISCAYDDITDRAQLHMAYARCIAKAGATPILVYYDSPKYTLPPVDGLVLSGGGDISPFFFTQKPTKNTGKVQFERDLFELSLFEQCVDIPILGICRGMQMLCTAYGGDLFSHIEGHSLDINERHDVIMDMNTRVGTIIGDSIYSVNSLHHQAVKRPGEGMVIAARDENGIIEAVEHETKPHFGVQWHPEKLGDISSAKLFKFFVDVCKGQN